MLYRHIAHHLDRWVFKATKGRTTFVSWWTGTPVVMVMTVGRKSGTPRTVPLVPVPYPEEADAFLLVATSFGKKRHPDWYHNLMAAGEAVCEMDGTKRTYQAQELDADHDEALWAHIVDFLPNYALYRQTIGTTRRIPIIKMTPKSDV